MNVRIAVKGVILLYVNGNGTGVFPKCLYMHFLSQLVTRRIRGSAIFILRNFQIAVLRFIRNLPAGGAGALHVPGAGDFVGFTQLLLGIRIKTG